MEESSGSRNEAENGACYGLNEVAKKLGVTRWTIEREIADKSLGSVRIRNRRLVTQKQLDVYVAKIEAESMGTRRPGRPVAKKR
jgi:excisionase family DNA binding protein